VQQKLDKGEKNMRGKNEENGQELTKSSVLAQPQQFVLNQTHSCSDRSFIAFGQWKAPENETSNM
jgi:hypothetical protein